MDVDQSGDVLGDCANLIKERIAKNRERRQHNSERSHHKAAGVKADEVETENDG